MADRFDACLKEKPYFLGMKTVCDFLIKIGVYPKLKGFDLLISAVASVLQNPSHIHSITTLLYPSLAKKFGISVSCVERNMRNAIETAYNSGKLQDIANKLYGGNFQKYERPTNGEFISYLVSIVKFAS